MAIPIPVKDLLLARRVESTRIEYKANWNPEKVLHSICAFANDIDNTGGGYIVLGVAETDEERTYFTIVLPIHPDFRKDTSADISSENDTLNDTLSGSKKTGGYYAIPSGQKGWLK